MTSPNKLNPATVRIAVGMGTCGIGNGADEVYKAFGREIAKKKLGWILVKTGCFGFCSEETLVNIVRPGEPLVILRRLKVMDVPQVVRSIQAGLSLKKWALCRIETWDHLTATLTYGRGTTDIPLWNELSFFKAQKKIVLRNCGFINPEDIDEYVAVGGYEALKKVLSEGNPDGVVRMVTESKLRGRGGAGFPTGKKWEIMKNAPGDEKYIICNADEGDPGAYMNRNEVESDPHMLIEGMVIGAFAMGAREGIVYIRAEYPLAIERLQRAIGEARARGFLGTNICGSGFSFDLNLVEGAGAFVCGEETALIASIEGRQGMPRPRPPFPAQKGLWDKPTNINNVETWCNIPVIIYRGAAWFAQTGTEKSAGTKVFSLVGKIKNTGLVELPLGASLMTLVYEIGGGTGTKKRVKSIQTGGPSGGCIPVDYFKTPVDYESLNALGAIMGSGGVVVMDSDNCMVDVARYFTEFTTAESCGKCVPCREGLYQLLVMLDRICEGKARMEDLAKLELLGGVIKDTSLCGMGQTGPNPILTTLKYFRDEYEDHIRGKHCGAGVCPTLFLSPCENSCPLHMNIPGFLQLVKEKRLVEAFDMIIRDNPFPASSGRICHFHCKMRCRREDIDESVSQGEVHRYVADTLYKTNGELPVIEALIKEKLPATKKKVAIVGAGPVGLTAAFYLVRLGHMVQIYEEKEEAGGILRYGIPEYRLPKKVLAREVGFIKKLGAKFTFGGTVDAKKLKRLMQTHDAVFLASGAYRSAALGIPGETFKNVYSATAFLEDALGEAKIRLGKNVLVIGAGNAAIDAARSAWRRGAQVTVVYRREKEDMPANKEEIREAEHEGIGFMFLAAPKELLADDEGRVRALRVTRMVPGAYDTGGRRVPSATQDSHDIPCDTVLVAIGERVDSAYVRSVGIGTNKNGTVQVDRFTQETVVPRVYAGGDCVSGPSTAIEAMAQAKIAAEVIDSELMGLERFGSLFKKYDYEMKASIKITSQGRQVDRMLSARRRRRCFSEVSQGLTRGQAKKEALRCLRCDVKEAR